MQLISAMLCGRGPEVISVFEQFTGLEYVVTGVWALTTCTAAGC